MGRIFSLLVTLLLYFALLISSSRLPIIIQFATFSLLLLFYANIIYKCTDSAWWDKYRRYFVGAYVAFNLTLLLLIISNPSYHILSIEMSNCDLFTNVVVVILTSRLDDATVFGNSWQNVFSALISAVIFTVLITALGYYGLKLAPLLKDGHVKVVNTLPLKRKENGKWNDRLSKGKGIGRGRKRGLRKRNGTRTRALRLFSYISLFLDTLPA